MVKKKHPGGRPLYPPVIDWKSIEAMCQIQCTQEEIASVVGCDLDTLQNRCKKEKNCSFSDFHKLKREGGKASLRRTQWQMAKTNPSLAIFLGKNYLKQTDKQEMEFSGSLTDLTDEQLLLKLKELEKGK